MQAKGTIDNRVQTANDPHEAELAGYVLAQVARRSCGRILDLEVECEGGRITLRGRARTHYAKQLAQQAVLDLSLGSSELANWIEVGVDRPRCERVGDPVRREIPSAPIPHATANATWLGSAASIANT
jgi:osmotically-inducible protein OsmY